LQSGSTQGGRFEIPGAVSCGAGEGGLPCARLTAAEAEAEICLLGATVTRYDAGGRKVLFCSETSKFASGKAIRGGVPVIFPWFGPHPTDAALPQHGFARTSEWLVTEARRTGDGDVVVVLELTASDATRALWPHDFLLRYTVSVGSRLMLTLEVVNRSGEPFQFTEAFHTYLAVSDVRNIRITGLENTEYADKVAGMARKRLPHAPLTLFGETDRVFVNTAAACTLHDPEYGDIHVSKSGSRSTVVWNPWDKADSMADLGGGQWPGFVCIETANALENAVTLAAGASHRMTAIIDPHE